jgi:hypothetical protein
MIRLRLLLGVPRLQRLLLSCVPIRQLLCLLLVLLLDLLCPGVVSPLLCQALMVRILLLLEPLPFLILPGNQAVLLLLILLVRPGVSGVRRLGTLVWSKINGMDGHPRWRIVRVSWLRLCSWLKRSTGVGRAYWHSGACGRCASAIAHCFRPGTGGNRRPAVV